jgi:hypothetical protein
VQATNAALADTAAAISITSARDIRISSTSDLDAVGSGAIVLGATRNVDLKINDSGTSSAPNRIRAAGNLTITATTGQITRSDADAVSASGQTIDAVFGSSLDGTISLKIQGNRLNIITPGVNDTAVEQAAINGKCDLFREIFGYEILLSKA